MGAGEETSLAAPIEDFGIGAQDPRDDPAVRRQATRCAGGDGGVDPVDRGVAGVALQITEREPDDERGASGRHVAVVAVEAVGTQQRECVGLQSGDREPWCVHVVRACRGDGRVARGGHALGHQRVDGGLHGCRDLGVERGAEVEQPIAFEHMECAVCAEFVFAEHDPVGVEMRLCADEDLAQSIEGEPHRLRAQPLFGRVSLIGTQPHPDLVHEGDDRRRSRGADSARPHGLGDGRMLRWRRLASEGEVRRGGIAHRDESRGVAGGRAGRRGDEASRVAVSVLLRDRVRTQLGA